MQNIVDIEQENLLLRKTIADKNHHIKILEEYILSLKQKQFGSSSEKLSPAQAELFDEADGDAAEIENENAASINIIEIPAHPRSTKRRVSIPADIPRVDIIHDLPDDQKICPHDGAALKRISSDKIVWNNFGQLQLVA
jgi:transposase